MSTGNQRNQARKPSTSWRDTIDGWVNDAAIRQHFLIALGMVLTAAVVIIGFAIGALGGVVASGAIGAGGAWWLQRLRRPRPTGRDQR